MPTLSNTIADAADLSQDEAQTAAGHILAFLTAESDSPSMPAMIAGTPGAQEALDGVDAAEPGAGIMALGAKLMGLGLDMGQMRVVGEALVGFAREHVGAETVDEAIASVPAISQFV